ncbi:MAG: phytoene desaturase family protein [Rhodovarius sp.]|nr:phytoene desaturase family protein [Rhodovarius sp.]
MRVIVIGAGVGGMVAAAELARRGAEVLVLERQASHGGKMRQLSVQGVGIDAGPTVFTMRWVFEDLFADAGRRLSDHLRLHPAEVLARHAWRRGGQLDLFADPARSAEAIATFAGRAEAQGFLAFAAESRGLFLALARGFIAAERPSPLTLAARLGPARLAALLAARAWQPMWQRLGRHFRDPRLRQLFGRYATYVGSSPWLAPAALMLIAHVEQEGVWLIEGGMRALADQLRALAEAQGARFRCGADVRQILIEGGRAAGVLLPGDERIGADAILFNGDVAALPALGAGGAAAVVRREQRSLSAITWCIRAPTAGFPLSHHNVFFGEDYEEEFRAIFQRREVPDQPTVYVCAQDRGLAEVAPGAPERLLLLINAPPDGDLRRFDTAEYAARCFQMLRGCGLEIQHAASNTVATTPSGFNALFPATGGALYGRASHGLRATLGRPAARSALPGLYLAGGSVHPGAGVPMAALSGRLAAARLLEDAAGRRGAIRFPAPG